MAKVVMVRGASVEQQRRLKGVNRRTMWKDVFRGIKSASGVAGPRQALPVANLGRIKGRESIGSRAWLTDARAQPNTRLRICRPLSAPLNAVRLDPHTDSAHKSGLLGTAAVQRGGVEGT